MATGRDFNRIDLNVSGRRDEGVAAGAISPGHAIKHDASGGVVVFSTAGGTLDGSLCVIALKDALQGKTVDDAYASGDQVFYIIPKRGDRLAVVLSAEQNRTVDDYLTYDSDGGFRLAAATEERVFQLKETIDLTGGSDTLVIVEKL